MPLYCSNSNYQIQLRDYLIIGHGLAGAILANRLDDLGKDLLVINDSKSNNSSTVAGGLYNPITGRKMVKTWLADQLFPLIEPTYESLERKLNAKFLNKIGIYRPFFSQQEQNDWQGKQADSKFKKYISRITTEPSPVLSVNDPYGGIHLKPAGFVNTKEFLNQSKNYLENRVLFNESVFNEKKLVISDEHCEYEGEKFRRVIFCNGLAAQNSRFFGWLPFNPVKGEVMNLKLEKQPDTIYNRGAFILPIKDTQVKVGATYQHDISNPNPTDEGMALLIEKFKKLSDEHFDIVSTQAGIRPATRDRRPFLGKHPKYEHIYLFNGFGSKGVSLIPFFSKQMVSFLEENIPLFQEVNIERYASHMND